MDKNSNSKIRSGSGSGGSGRRTRSQSFFSCFHLDSMEDLIDTNHGSNDPNQIEYIGKHMNDIPMLSPPIPEDKKNKRGSKLKKTKEKGSRRKAAKRVLSRIIRAIVFETFLTKKTRNKKVRQDPSRSDSSLSSKIDKISDMRSSGKWLKDDEMMTDGKISSSCRSSLSISSVSNSSFSGSSSMNSSRYSSSGQSKSFRSNSFEFRNNNNNSLLDDPKQSKVESKKPGGRSCINGLYLLLVSLVVLIFWGKVCAIICTSTWVYFGPARRRIGEDRGKGKEVETESKEYKKRVIMEGLLERNNHCRVSDFGGR